MPNHPGVDQRARAGAGLRHRTGWRARRWLPVLMLIVAFESKSAGEKQSAAMAVRVTVTRSCTVDTAAPTATAVACSSRRGPPVLTSMATLPAASVGTSPTRLVTDTSASLVARQADETAAAVPGTEAPTAAPMGTPVAPERGAAPGGRIEGGDEAATAAPAAAAVPSARQLAGDRSAGVGPARRHNDSVRQLTVNF